MNAHAEQSSYTHAGKHAQIRRTLLDAGMAETGIVATGKLRFHSEVRDICAGNSCGSYDSCWACPPAVGTFDECRERCLRYEIAQVFSRAYELEDAFDFEGMIAAMADFKHRTIDAAPTLRDCAGDCLILSNEGCGICAKCTWPDEPCRFPDRCLHSIEGYGLVVSEVAQQAGIRYSNGPNTVTFFGAVFYDE